MAHPLLVAFLALVSAIGIAFLHFFGRLIRIYTILCQILERILQRGVLDFGHSFIGDLKMPPLRHLAGSAFTSFFNYLFLGLATASLFLMILLGYLNWQQWAHHGPSIPDEVTHKLIESSGFLLGAAVGFASSFLLLVVQWWRNWFRDRRLRRAVAAALVVEIDEAIGRCRRLIQAFDAEGKFSLSRVFVSFGSRFIGDLPRVIPDPEVVELTHRLYYRFDLVNFNVEAKNYGAAVAFAKDYLPEMEEGVASLKRQLRALKLLRK